MSNPRQVIPGRSYMITRRCTQRQMLMRPDAETNNAFIYCLAVAAERCEIDVLFTVAMGNHHHTGIHDRHGNYPAFLGYFHKLFAKCQNALRGRWENFWSSEQTSVVRLVGPDDVMRKLVYCACNPVEARLVDHAVEWPGVSSLRATLEGESLSAERPAHFFRRTGPMPETATLRFVRPKDFEAWSQVEWASTIREGVLVREKEAARARASKRLRTLGVRAVRRQRWWSRPKSKEPRRSRSPRVAAVNKWRRVEALLEDKRFLQAYREARERMIAGMKNVLFPPGTYWLRHFAAVACVDVPLIVTG